VHALFNSVHAILDKTTSISRKVRA